MEQPFSIKNLYFLYEIFFGQYTMARKTSSLFSVYLITFQSNDD